MPFSPRNPVSSYVAQNAACVRFRALWMRSVVVPKLSIHFAVRPRWARFHRVLAQKDRAKTSHAVTRRLSNQRYLAAFRSIGAMTGRTMSATSHPAFQTTQCSLRSCNVFGSHRAPASVAPCWTHFVVRRTFSANLRARSSASFSRCRSSWAGVCDRLGRFGIAGSFTSLTCAFIAPPPHDDG
jgi:hypothetical protein